MFIIYINNRKEKAAVTVSYIILLGAVNLDNFCILNIIKTTCLFLMLYKLMHESVSTL